ncbi:TBC1 domain family member 1 isoform X1 [Sardina pilchardus]|uniref:TBC1 domain family member 1 isoform X1 n=1 Tax=Sardina pilchardus TaxID=27697 RepID=UPI002E0E3D36
MEEVCFKVKQSKSTLASTLAQVESEEVQYRLCMVGSLSVHPLTTMPMLPWILAEIRKPQTVEKNRSTSPSWPHSGSTILDQPVMLHITATCVWCVLDIAGPGKPWDPLQHALLWQHQPHQITKLIHNSQDPSYFCCLARQEGHATCHVFHCEDQHKVPEIISTLRQASKSSERLEESTAAESALSSSCQDDKHHCDAVSPNAITFAKKFEVLFCGRVVVAHRKAPPALIDECIEKFSRATGGIGGLAAGIRRVLSLQPTANGVQMGSGEGNLSRKPAFFQRDPSLPSLQAQDENGLSLELQNRSVTGACGVRPTSILENRTMLFTVGRSQIFLVSPDTKKVAIEKSFREISFCSQGIRHVDHFGFICRESSESGTCQFVCYVFQCTDESLVDEIMLTLKQAFSVAAQQQVSQTHGQQCENCPMLTLHRVCERIEGVHPSKAKLELQRHLATLDSQEQTAVFQITMKARPKSDQEENELLVSCLRRLYEEKQKSHTHTYNKQSAVAEEKGDAGLSGSRLRLEQFKSRAKRSLTESLEGIWKGGNKSKCQSEGDFSSSDSTLNNSNQDPSLDDPLCSPLALSSPLRSHNSTGDLKRLESGSPLQETQQPAFRRRASTIGHSPTQCSPSGPLGPPQQPSAATKPKLVRHYSVSTDSPHQSKTLSHVDDKSTPCISPSLSPHFPKSVKLAVAGGDTHIPRSPKRSLRGLRVRLHSSASVPNFLKFLAPVEENEDDPQRPSDVAALSSPGAMCVVGEDSPIRSHRYSWRQQIFLRVATPQKGTDTTDRGDCALDVGGALALGGVSGSGLSADGQLGSVPEERRRRSGPEIRELWRKAILQQILLLRMERENQKLQASENDRQSRRLKLDYEEITPCLKDVTLVWERMLGTPGRAKVKFDTESIHSAVGRGVPRQHRGEIWKLLSEQYNLRQQVPSKSPSTDTPYKELLKQLTSQQHAILIDLGRTFPTHPYFSTQLGAGQLSLYNLLKAYSLLDPEVGYCQGLSFVAGVLLLHMGEEEAFTLLKFLMYDMGLRKQYRPDMIILQIQMYQLSRLLHDYHRELYNHLEKYEIGPSLYAAPWFLTAFASHFPLGFVARVFDMLFLQGSEVIFKVALSLLGSHKPLILQHDSLESIVDFIKTTLPNLGLVQMEKTINQVFEMDISKQLQAYEVEYHVLQDELVDNISTLNQSQRTAQLEKTNCSLRQQNMDLLEELQVAHAKIHWLETRVEGLVTSENALQKEMCGLQQDKASLQATVSHLQTQMLDLGLPLDFGPEHYHQDSDPNQLHNQNQPQRASPKL